jgi:hypothetical protein
VTVTKKAPVKPGPAQATKPRSRTYTYWMTRDSSPENGTPAPKIRIWTAMPARIDLGKGAVWMVDDDERDFFCEWTIEQALGTVRTYPDDDRMCIRVEGDGVKATVLAAQVAAAAAKATA